MKPADLWDAFCQWRVGKLQKAIDRWWSWRDSGFAVLRNWFGRSSGEQ